MVVDSGAQIELVDVYKQFGDITAVDGIDLQVRQDEFFSLLGPSGCGKTTTLRMISGFEEPTSGEIYLDGESTIGVSPNDRDTNLVFQHLAIFPHMTVAENVGYGLKKKGVADDERTDLVEEYLELVDLEGYGDRDPTDLSGGQQQRVALARALINEPQVVLLDEPLGSLDRKLRKYMQVELRNIHEQVDGSFFYVTHNQEVAMALSDRLAVMNDGKIEQVGRPEEIYNEPASEFVADFIGDTNLFDGTTRRANGRTRIRVGDSDGFEFETDARVEDSDVTVSVRPESIELHEEGTGYFDGHVVERYFQGDRTKYVVESDGNLPEVEATISETTASTDRGERVSVSFDESAAVVFD